MLQATYISAGECPLSNGVGGVGVMPTEWLQAELAVHEDGCVPTFRKYSAEVAPPSCEVGCCEFDTG